MEPEIALTEQQAAALAVDETGWVVAVNRRCAALFSAGPELLCGSALATLFPNEAEVAPRLRRAAGDSIRLQARRLTGAAFHVEAQATISPDGTLTCRLWDVLGAAPLPPRTAPAGAHAA